MPSPEAKDEAALKFHFDVYVFADKYQCRKLGEEAVWKFAETAHLHWDKPSFANVVGLIYSQPRASSAILRDAA